MDPISQNIITEAGKEAISLVINKTTGDNHPEYEKAVIEGTAETIKELAKSDIQTAVRIYESIKTNREQREFFNFSKILHKFALLVKTKPKEEIKDGNDFFWNVIEHAKSVSNDEIQELIAKIMAGEYNIPGTYSMSTLQTLKMLEKSELELFEKYCGLLINDKQIPKKVFSSLEFMTELQIDFENFNLLQSLGLFLSNGMTIPLKNLEKQDVEIYYFDKKIIFTPQNENYLKIKSPDFFCLSISGMQILKHLNPQYNDKYFLWLKENYKIPNYRILI